MDEHSQVSVLIIYTGGTIGMMQDPKTHLLKPFDLENIIIEVPELKKFGFKLDHVAFDPLIDSSNVNPAFWVKIADTIYKNYDKYNGFVVLHGTDTMAYTASALSFMFENLSKPIILTGSQLPIGNIRTDGKENLISSVEIAAAEISGNALVPEVCIYFENKLYRGNRTTKLNAEYFNAFYSGNCTPLAKSGVYINYEYDKIIYPDEKEKLKLHRNLENNIAILKIFPGISPELIRAITDTDDLKAIILETFGAGNAPTDEGFICAIRNALGKGIIILNVSQCLQGSVEQGKYETSAELERIGVISGYDITTEAALTKLMVLFGKKLDREEIIFNLNKSIAGEITPI